MRFDVFALGLFCSFTTAFAQVDFGDSNTPYQAQAVKLTAGANHFCAITTSATQPGALRCWGSNASGQIGNGLVNTVIYTVPTAPRVLPLGVTAVAAGNSHTCAIQFGIVKCWGSNTYGQSGGPVSSTPISLPSIVPGLPSPATALAAGGNHTCAIAGGALYCWGQNSYGQIGNGSTNSSISSPYLISNSLIGGSPLKIIAGGHHTCALNSVSKIRCWGRDQSGQVGNGSATSTNVLLPVQVSSLSFQELFAGDEFNCAMANGAVHCWGRNSVQQAVAPSSLTIIHSPTPITSTLISGVLNGDGGSVHTCIHRSNGGVYCWGSDQNQALGNGIGVSANGGPYLSSGSGSWSIQSLATNQNSTCVKISNVSGIRCWGLIQGTSLSAPNSFYLPSDSPNLLSTGGETSCAVIANGSIKCWGQNQNGQLGNGSTAQYSSTPVSVLDGPGTTSTLSNAASISVGWRHACSLLNNGSVKCWGEAKANGTTQNSNTPNSIPINNAVSISSGLGSNCALISDGTVKCWGQNSTGELGNGTLIDSTDPVIVVSEAGSTTPLSGVVSITSNYRHYCALIHNGTMKCWGRNQYGELGNGTGGYDSNTGLAMNSPVPVTVLDGAGSTALTGISSISAGGFHTCASLTNGLMKCWGKNNRGQLGVQPDPNDLLATNPYPVTFASSLGNAISQLSAGTERTCALISNGTIQCWGSNYAGELGNGLSSNTGTIAPVNVLDSTSNATLTNVTELSAKGEWHGCARQSNNTIKCWGYNAKGELGNGTTSTNPSLAVSVIGL